uniref:Reverse transcriptase domain-containing protein n=1 Tax=Cannabis sativa TaxID=3483 RepID=A0A803QAN7_CANSA
MGEKGKEIQVVSVDLEKEEIMKRDSNLEMEMLELFEDITLEDVVVNKACVGKVVGCKNMPASVVKKILTGVWRRLGFWRMKKCEEGVLGFFFDEEDDYQFVMERRPWIINGVLLNIKPWPVEGEVHSGEFEVAAFWVQFHGLPTRFLANENIPILAKKVGHLVRKEEKKKEELVRRGYLRSKIELWLSHPFPSGFFLKADGKPDSWVQFKYEKLPHLCFSCGRLAHWDKVCSDQPTMVYSKVGPAVPMYGTWIKSETGSSNCFNMKGKGSAQLIFEREEVPEWDLSRRKERNTWKRHPKVTEKMEKNSGDIAVAVQETGEESGKEKGKVDDSTVTGGLKRKGVQEGTSTTVSGEVCTGEECGRTGGISVSDDFGGINVENVGNRQLKILNIENGPNYLELPNPDFSLGPDGEERIPDIGPTIAQSLEIPHSWLCRSQRPHDFPEPTPLKWPNDDPKAQENFFNLYGPDLTDMYKAQASLICNPPDLSMMIVQLLGSKKRKPHTWYHPWPAVTSFEIPRCPSVEDGEENEKPQNDVAITPKFSLGSNEGGEKPRRKSSRRSEQGPGLVSRGSGVKTRRGRKKAEAQQYEIKEFEAETKVGEEDVRMVMNRLGFPNVVGIPSVGIGGGFCLAWRQVGLIEIKEVFAAGFHAYVPASHGNVGWHLMCLYGTPYAEEKVEFWKWATEIVSGLRESWVVLGDLNVILEGSEKSGGREFHRREGAFLREFLDETGGVDLGFHGVRCTWHNARKGMKNVRKRLDRGLAEASWCTHFPNAKVTNLPILASDHSPIVLSTIEEHRRLNYPFRFLEVWTSSPGCEKVVDRAWKCDYKGRKDKVLLQKLGKTKCDLKKWNQESFGFCDQNLRNFKRELVEIQNKAPTKENLEREASVQLSIMEMEANLERVWKQKSRELWTRKGDGNTKFFHASTVIRRRRNKIESVESDGTWLHGREDIGNFMRNQFMQVFESQNTVIDDDLDSLFSEMVSEEENDSICRTPSEDEIKQVVYALHPLKSPGPDGFSGIFYRKYWRIVGGKVCEMVQGFFEDGSVCAKLNHTFLCLIPKVSSASRFDHFRPISLCNFCYKIISRILTDRLKVVIDRLVSPFQSAFIPGRWIAESSIMAQEVLHNFKRKKGKHGVMAVKTDMSKAYDRLEWNFLLRVLKANGFSEKVCKIIMSCVTSVSYSVLLNGAPLAPFNPKRGLRQGDPLSPFLFILCSEVLSKLITRAEANGELSGVKVSRDAVPISHLFYADDAIFFCKATGGNAAALMECISRYERWSGQEVNKQKSGVMFSPNTPLRCREEAKSIMNINGLKHSEKYLGNPFFFSAKKRKDFHFIKDKVKGRLEGWRAKNLSQAGRTTLVGSVLQSVPCYAMSTALVPKTVCDELDRIVARFWWIGNSEKQRYRSFKSWADICQPKRCGGLGLRRFRDINLALLSKLSWGLLTRADKPWIKLLESRYCQGLDAWRVEKRAGDSWVWQGILEARKICKIGAGVLIGDGRSDMWERPWVPGVSMEEVRSSFTYSRRHAFVKVSDLFVEGNREWNADLINECFEENVAQAILSIRPLISSNDSLFWKASKSGKFSVKSSYWVSQQDRFKDPNKVWEKLWRSPIHPRLKLLLWKIWSDVLPTKSRIGRLEEGCVLCNNADETVLHLFGACSAIKAVLFHSSWGIRIDDLHWNSIMDFGLWWTYVNDESLQLFVACTCASIWKWRNNVIFQNRPFSIADLISDVQASVREMTVFDLADPGDVPILNAQDLSDLSCDSDLIPFHTDASISGEEAGLAAVQRAADDGVLAWVATDFTKVSGILEGELLAILLTLQLARQLNVQRIKVHSDSKVAVMALNLGCLPLAWGTYPVFESCRCLCKCFDKVVFCFCPRAENSVADALAGWARGSKSSSQGVLRDIAPSVAMNLL